MNTDPAGNALDLQSDARTEARRQWNTTACGELEGDKSHIEYFERVAQDRYRQQPWQHAYFGFDRFAGKDVLEIGIGQGTDLLQYGPLAGVLGWYVTTKARKPLASAPGRA